MAAPALTVTCRALAAMAAQGIMRSRGGGVEHAHTTFSETLCFPLLQQLETYMCATSGKMLRDCRLAAALQATQSKHFVKFRGDH